VDIPTDGDFFFAEHSGAAIESGFRDLEKIEADMGRLSLQPVVNKTGNPTATARALDESSASSALEAWSENVKDSTEQALQFTADRSGEATGGSVEVTQEFTLSLQAGEEAKTIYESYRMGLLPKKVAFEELKRLSIISDDWTWEEVEEMYESDKRGGGAGALGGMQGV